MREKFGLLFRICRRLLRLILKPSRNYGLYGDLEEIYSLMRHDRGRFRADLWYCGQIFKTIPAYFRDLLYWWWVRLANYFKITYRNFKRQKVYSLINVSGLALGMACCLCILTYVHHERDRSNSQILIKLLKMSSLFQGL